MNGIIQKEKERMGGNEIIGVGAYLPQRCMANEELAQTLDTSDEWIRERTGIATRHIAAEGEYTSHLAAHAAREALANAGMNATEVDLILIATATPDTSFPSTATHVQRLLGASRAVAMDVNAACAGFVYALHLADALMHQMGYRHVLVIGAETMSRVVDWNDRRTAILFGDGAGACVLSATEERDRGILTSLIASDGTYADLLHTDGGVSSTQTAGVLSMEGKEVFRHAVEKMSHSVEACCARVGIVPQQLRLLVPHQANARILSACAKRLGIKEEQCVMTVEHHANTSAASIPLALAYAKKTVILEQGDYVMFTALGAGFTWGSCLVRW